MRIHLVVNTIVMVRMGRDPGTKAYVARRIADGKTKCEATRQALPNQAPAPDIAELTCPGHLINRSIPGFIPTSCHRRPVGKPAS